jgi:hypothetical protein
MPPSRERVEPLAVRFDAATSARELNPGHLQLARTRCYIPAMDDRQYWTERLKQAEARARRRDPAQRGERRR